MFTATKMAVLGGDEFRDEWSLAFDGTDDYIDLGDTNDLGTADFTIVAWVKAADFDTKYFVGKRQDDNNRWYLRTSAGNPPRLQFYSKMGGSETLVYLGGSSINLDNLQNVWVHFAISADRSGNIIGYINGVLDDSDSADDTDLDNTGNLYTSRFDSAYSAQNVSEVAIYDKALSGSEVATIYNGREPYNHKEGIATGNLTAWWRMGDGSLDRQAVEGGIITDMKQTTYIDTTDLVTNGTFTGNATGWSLATGWAYDSNNATCSANNGNLAQDVSAVADTVYRVELDITAYTSGTLIADIGGSSSISFPQATGSHVVYMLTVNTNDLRFYGGAFRGTVDNIRVYKVFGNPGVTYNMTPSDFEGDTP